MIELIFSRVDVVEPPRSFLTKRAVLAVLEDLEAAGVEPEKR